MTKGSDTLGFAYNESGLRTEKTVNGVTHSYVWQGSKLAADITGEYALYFHYDSSGDVIGFTMTANGTDTEYFYVKNLQGDILKVITATGTEAATYIYDAWGKLLTSAGDMADINPLRYRGYYYDVETGLYYLQSRYYDPEAGRFINPDAFATTDADGVLSANMFAYCENNPVTKEDHTGKFSLTILAASTIAGAAGSLFGYFAFTKSEDRSFKGALSAALTGAAVGALGTVSKPYKAAAAIAAGAINFASTYIRTKEDKLTKFRAAMSGGIYAATATYLGTGTSAFYSEADMLTKFTVESTYSFINGINMEILAEVTTRVVKRVLY